MKIPFQDFHRVEADLTQELIDRVQQVVRSGWYIFGPECEGFEAEFAQYLEAAHCVSVNSGTDALELSLRALGIGPGQKVIAVGNAGPYASCAIRQVGAEPLFVEIDPLTRNICLEALEKALQGADVGGAIITHLYGEPVDLDRVGALMRDRGLPWVEDCAHAHGARWRDRPVGTAASVGCFSFYPTKNLGALGDGGACVTHCESIAEKLRALRQYGWKERYEVVEAGGRNSRLDEMQAAVLRVKLRRLDAWNARRQALAELYRGNLSGHSALQLPPHNQGAVSHLFVVRHSQRERLQERLSERGVATAVHYPVPDSGSEHLVETSLHCREVLSLPCFPGLEDEEVHTVCQRLLEVL